MGEILVTGGKGTTGRIIARELAHLGIPHRVGSRRPTHDGEVAFDWRRPELARAALRNVETIYVVAPTDTSDHAGVVLPMLEVALKQGVKKVVLLSASSLEAGGPMMGQIHAWLIQNAADWAVLRPSWFMQNLHNQHHETITEEDALYTATGEGRVGFIDAADIARVAVAALISKEPWNRDFVLTGPEAVSYADVAALLGDGLGRRINHVALHPDAYAQSLVEKGMGEEYARALAGMDERIAAGSENRVTSHVYDLTRREPTDLKSFIRRNIDKWTPR